MTRDGPTRPIALGSFTGCASPKSPQSNLLWIGFKGDPLCAGRCPVHALVICPCRQSHYQLGPSPDLPNLNAHELEPRILAVRTRGSQPGRIGTLTASTELPARNSNPPDVPFCISRLQSEDRMRGRAPTKPTMPPRVRTTPQSRQDCQILPRHLSIEIRQ